MGDIKTCSSCGNSIPAEAVFCPNCGQKQEPLAQEPEQEIQVPEESIIADVEESTPDTISEADSYASPGEWNQSEQVSQEPSVEETSTAQQTSVYPDTAAPSASPGSETIQQPYGQAQPQQPSFWQDQPQQDYQQQAQPAQTQQQASYPQPTQQPAAPKKPKKKFPWVFTILWIAMLAFIGVWVFLWTTYPEYENPLSTLLDADVIVDVIRVMVPVISAILLIYTLNLKLVVKKLNVIPTILLIIFFLISAFMFLAFELVEGDWPHDLIRPVAETIFQDLY